MDANEHEFMKWCRERLVEVRELLDEVEAGQAVVAPEDHASLREEEQALATLIRLHADGV
jgi:hypothetical protein